MTAFTMPVAKGASVSVSGCVLPLAMVGIAADASLAMAKTMATSGFLVIHQSARARNEKNPQT